MDYTTAFNTEIERATDFLRVIIEAPIEIPSRPCPPDTPPAWWGVSIDLTYDIAFASWTNEIK